MEGEIICKIPKKHLTSQMTTAGVDDTPPLFSYNNHQNCPHTDVKPHTDVNPHMGPQGPQDESQPKLTNILIRL